MTVDEFEAAVFADWDARQDAKQKQSEPSKVMEKEPSLMKVDEKITWDVIIEERNILRPRTHGIDVWHDEVVKLDRDGWRPGSRSVKDFEKVYGISPSLFKLLLSSSLFDYLEKNKKIEIYTTPNILLIHLQFITNSTTPVLLYQKFGGRESSIYNALDWALVKVAGLAVSFFEDRLPTPEEADEITKLLAAQERPCPEAIFTGDCKGFFFTDKKNRPDTSSFFSRFFGPLLLSRFFKFFLLNRFFDFEKPTEKRKTFL